MRTRFFDGRASCDGQEIELSVYGIIRDPNRLEAWIELIGELAGADLFGAAAMRGLADVRYTPPEGPWNARTAPSARRAMGALTVTIRPVRSGRHTTVTEVRGPSSATQPLRVRVVDGEPRGDVPAGALPPGAFDALQHVGSGQLEIGTAEAVFAWTAVETDRGRLLAGCDLVAAFGRPATGGAFR